MSDETKMPSFFKKWIEDKDWWERAADRSDYPYCIVWRPRPRPPPKLPARILIELDL